MFGEAEHKFWVAVQPSSDILEFGDEDPNNTITGTIHFQDLLVIKEEQQERKDAFNKEHGMTYKKFTETDNPHSMWTDEWRRMERDASLICLGDEIVKELTKQQTDIRFEAEV